MVLYDELFLLAILAFLCIPGLGILRLAYSGNLAYFWLISQNPPKCIQIYKFYTVISTLKIFTAGIFFYFSFFLKFRRKFLGFLAVYDPLLAYYWRFMPQGAGEL